MTIVVLCDDEGCESVLKALYTRGQRRFRFSEGTKCTLSSGNWV